MLIQRNIGAWINPILSILIDVFILFLMIFVSTRAQSASDWLAIACMAIILAAMTFLTWRPCRDAWQAMKLRRKLHRLFLPKPKGSADLF